MAWIRTIVGAVAATLAVRGGVARVFDIPPAFQPLAVAGPTVFLTVVGAGAGLGVAVAIDKFSDRPVPLFQRIVVAALAVSLLPDFWLLTDSASEAFPGATVPAVVTLMAQHVVAATIVCWSVTRPLGSTA